LLGAVAVVRFEMLSQAYVGFAIENPALYRPMFGPALAESSGARPAPAETAGAEAKAVLEEVILHGARSGLFAVAPENHAALEIAALSCWSAVHGLTILTIDRKADTRLPVRKLVKGRARHFLRWPPSEMTK
jgi:hypothetical protein